MGPTEVGQVGLCEVMEFCDLRRMLGPIEFEPSQYPSERVAPEFISPELHSEWWMELGQILVFVAAWDQGGALAAQGFSIGLDTSTRVSAG